MRSAFETMCSSFGSETSTSSGQEMDKPKTHRVIGFAEVSSATYKIVAPQLSCDLNQRATRQSSLGKALLLHNFEESRPRLSLKISSKVQPKLRSHTAPVLEAKTSEPGPPSVPFMPSTLPSGAGGHIRQGSSSSSSGAVPIPALTKAYTAPVEGLPELSPSAVHRLMGEYGPQSGACSNASTPGRSISGPSALGKTRFGVANRRDSDNVSPLNPAPSPPSRAGSTTTLGATTSSNDPRAAMVQVMALKEALRREQEEVARLRREVARLSLRSVGGNVSKPHRRFSNGIESAESAESADMAGPVTPEAAEQGPAAGFG